MQNLVIPGKHAVRKPFQMDFRIDKKNTSIFVNEYVSTSAYVCNTYSSTLSTVFSRISHILLPYTADSGNDDLSRILYCFGAIFKMQQRKGIF